MTIEQKLELLRKAIEMGADVHVSFHDGPERFSDLTKAQAKEIASVMSEFTDIPFKPNFHGTTNWFESKEDKFSVTAFYTPVASDFMEEDVILDGMEETA